MNGAKIVGSDESEGETVVLTKMVRPRKRSGRSSVLVPMLPNECGPEKQCEEKRSRDGRCVPFGVRYRTLQKKCSRGDDGVGFFLTPISSDARFRSLGKLTDGFVGLPKKTENWSGSVSLSRKEACWGDGSDKESKNPRWLGSTQYLPSCNTG